MNLAELRKKWVFFLDEIDEDEYYEFTAKDAMKYSELMKDTYPAIMAEWGNERISKELVLLLLEVEKFGLTAFDSDGNSRKGDLYANYAIFHSFFKDAYKDGKLSVDADGMLVVPGYETWEGNQLYVNPNDFILPDEED